MADSRNIINRSTTMSTLMCIGIDVLTHDFTCYTLPVVEMALSHSSNLFIGSTINSAQGDFHIRNRDSKSGMHNFRSVQKSILIDDPMRDFIS